MVNLLRLILFSVVCFWFSPVYADIPKKANCEAVRPADVPGDGTMVYGCGGVTSDGKGAVTTIVSGFGQHCVAGPSCGSYGVQSVWSWTDELKCPANSSVSGASCGCNSGYKESGGQCVPDIPPAECTANSELVDGVCMCMVGFKEGSGGCVVDGKKLCEVFSALESMSGGMLVKDIKLVGRVNHESQFCIESSDPDAMREGLGCTVAFDQTMVAENHDGSSTSYGKWVMSSLSGNSDYSCSTSEPVPPKKPDTPKCANGAPGTVNGVEVCVPRQADNGVETGGKDTTTTNDGTNTTKKENNSTTVCKDGKCTTTTVTNTTVTNNASGNATTSSTTSSTTTSQGDFCSKNPKNAQCNGTGTSAGTGSGDGEGDKDPSEFGGACAAGFTCKGDAIQCAIAREQHVRACKMFDDSSPESLLYEAEKGKEGNQADTLEGNETIDIAGRIDTTDALGGAGSGVQDLNLTVAGRSVTLQLSILNDPLRALGAILIAISFLLAFRIVGRG